MKSIVSPVKTILSLGNIRPHENDARPTKAPPVPAQRLYCRTVPETFAAGASLNSAREVIRHNSHDLITAHPKLVFARRALTFPEVGTEKEFE